MRSIVIILFACIALCQCAKNNKQKAFQIFNEGAAFSIQAIHETDSEKADSLERKAIAKYLETLALDSSHALVRSTLGHSYYLVKDFRKGVYWFEQAILRDSSFAANYIEYGLCQINLGGIREGELTLQKAFKLDSTHEIRKIAVNDLLGIGTLAFDYGDGYEKQGEKDKGLTYRKFAVGVLLAAYKIDSNNRAVNKGIADFTEFLGDTQTSQVFRKKLPE